MASTGSLLLPLHFYSLLFSGGKGKQLVYIEDKIDKHFTSAVVPLSHNQNANTNTFSKMLRITAVVPLAHDNLPSKRLLQRPLAVAWSSGLDFKL